VSAATSFASPTIAVAVLSMLTGCASTSRGVRNPDARAQFERLKTLSGTYTTSAGSTRPGMTFRYTLTGGGSVVQEEFYPGTPEAMVTMYHLDGPDLVLTHYCAAGNQPTMRAGPSFSDGTIPFELTGGTNLEASGTGHMSAALVRVEGPDRVWSQWTFAAGGGSEPSHASVFVLRRTGAP
jgi:hypothetical protein